MTLPDSIAHVHEPSARSDAAYVTAVDPSSVADGATPPRGWRPRPGELVSLWDMLHFPAHAFVVLMQGLAKLETYVQITGQWLAQPDAPPLPGTQELKAQLVRQGVAEDLGALQEIFRGEWQRVRETMAPLVSEIEKACTALQLDSGVAKLRRMRQEFEAYLADLNLPGFLQGHFKDLRERIEDQLKSRLFMFVPPEEAKYFLEGKPFGDAVHDKLPEINRDIVDANKCLGMGLPTAAVIHLMRVMEYGIRRLAKRLKVPPKKVKHKTWDMILREINGAISSLSASPSLSARKRALSADFHGAKSPHRGTN